MGVRRMAGTESFHQEGRDAGFGVLDYWRWSSSDLLANVERGAVAEFLVASALGVTDNHPRIHWAGYDILGPDGISIEVKSAAYWQSWPQERPSAISFQIRPLTRAWDPVRLVTAKLDPPRRAAHIYVFCLLGREDEPFPDPLDLAQWQFFVVPTRVLDEDLGASQRSIALGSLVRLLARKGKGPVGYDGLWQAINAIPPSMVGME